MAALLVPKPGGLVLHGARQPPAAAPAPRNAAPALARPSPRPAPPAASSAPAAGHGLSAPAAGHGLSAPANAHRAESLAVVLDQAQNDLAEYCSVNPNDPDCARALQYFCSKRQALEEHCDFEHDGGEHEARACEQLSNLERVTREQMATGNLHDFKCSLLIQQRAEERSLQRAGAAPASAAAAPSPPPPSAQQQQQLDGARAELVRLFRRLDTDNDGLLSKFELQMALEKAGAALADDDSRMVSDALGDQGYLNVDDFVAVVQSGTVKVHSLVDDTTFLRHALHMHGPHHNHLD